MEAASGQEQEETQSKLRCSCKNDIIYALVLKNKVRRLTFSKNLAEWIQGKNPDHQIWKLDLVVQEEVSYDTGDCLYGIMGHKGRLLRAAVSYEEAEYLTRDSNRSIVACRVKKRELENGSVAQGQSTVDPDRGAKVECSNHSRSTKCEGSSIGRAPDIAKVVGSSPTPPDLMADSSVGRESLLEVVCSNQTPRKFCQDSLKTKPCWNIQYDGGVNPSPGTLCAHSSVGRAPRVMPLEVPGSIPGGRYTFFGGATS